jgi:hypothetical protein
LAASIRSWFPATKQATKDQIGFKFSSRLDYIVEQNAARGQSRIATLQTADKTSKIHQTLDWNMRVLANACFLLG